VRLSDTEMVLTRLLEAAAMACLPVAAGIGILRYRLWDIDLLINRTLAYGALTISVVGIYVLVVGYLGALFPTGGNSAISLVATGIVAILFQPLRQHLQRGINRLLYGQRDEPYAVLSQLGQRLEATLAPEAVLPTIVQSVREALKLPYAAIALRQAEGFVIAAEVGVPAADPLRLPLSYQGEPVGELLLGPRGAGEAFSSADRRLLEDLARQAGVAADAVRLTGELQRAQERLVGAREEERRRLRRDLHDGLGPLLGGVSLGLAGVHHRLRRDPAAAEQMLQRLQEQLQTATGEVRRLVDGLRPPGLDELGLVSALRERATRFQHGPAGLSVTVEGPEVLPPLPAATEVAAYRIALEALTNAARHAHARRCVLRLAIDGALELEVCDDGHGIPAVHRAGVGLASMRQRAREVGGTCTIRPGPDGGTRVTARLPVAVP
jgi:signal transduction histidine kinase